MALPTSGALTLDAIHVEAGGTTGTTCSLNDTDIRGLNAASGKTINSTLGTTIDFDDFYGASVTVATDLTASGTAFTKTTTTGSGKSVFTTVYNGIGTTFSASAPMGSWSDQDFATATRGAFKIYDIITSGGVGVAASAIQVVVDSSAGQGISWSAFCGFRYIRLNSASGTIYFDSNLAGNGSTSNFGTQGGGASSGTNGTSWSIVSGYTAGHLPSSGSISLHLTN